MTGNIPAQLKSSKTAFFSLLLAISLLALWGCGKPEIPSPQPPQPKSTTRPYTVLGQTYYPLKSSHGFRETGTASWYGRDFHGKPTACGEKYNMYAMTAAHRVLPLQTRVRVTSLENGRSVVVRVNDRGPFVKNRIIDLSYAAAKKLGMVKKGTARVRVETLRSLPRDLPGRFYIQTGSFLVAENAQRQRSSLQTRGYPGTRIVTADIHGRTFYRVQAGIFNGLYAAQKVLPRLLKENPSSFILAD